MLIDGAMVDLEQENRRLQAELQAQTQELRGSRARLIAVGDEERRRLERDLHDGAQSRFAGVALHLRLAQRKAPPDSELAQMLDEAIGELSSGIEELRELARGIHPAVLTQRGLEAALESLASRAPLPVDVRATLEQRLPAAVETAAYFAVSEALANVVKHAGAGLVAVDVRDRARPARDRRQRRRLRRRDRAARHRGPRRRARRARRDRQPARRAARACTSRSPVRPRRAGGSSAAGEAARDQRTAHPRRRGGPVRARALGARALGRRGARLRRRRAHAPERRDDRGARAPSAHRAAARLPRAAARSRRASCASCSTSSGWPTSYASSRAGSPKSGKKPLGVEERVEMGDPPV